MKIGIVAPPWVPVPPPAYGGTELAIDTQARGLLAAGHDVELFTTGESSCPVPKKSLLLKSEGMLIGNTTIEMRHVLSAYEAINDVDIIHDHTVIGPALSPDLTDIPVVTTNHGPFADDTMAIWKEISRRDVPLICISRHQASTASPSVTVNQVIHHGIDLERFPTGAGEGRYVACLGRMAAAKGIHTAIKVAKEAEVPLLIGAKMREPNEQQYFDAEIRPLLGDGVEYLGELQTEEKFELLCGASALLNPIQWAEPFGLVMIEAMACGTPVISTPCGSVPEIVKPGRTGFICSSREEMVEAVHQSATLDREQCRSDVQENFSMERMVRDHISFYETVIESRPAPANQAISVDDLSLTFD